MEAPATQTAPAPPAWLGLPAGWEADAATAAGGAALRRRSTTLRGRGRFFECAAETGATASAESLLEASRALYACLLDGLDPGQRPLRFWNFMPGITEPSGGPEAHRYMVFNRGRAEGMAAAGRPGSGFTASAVGFPPGHRDPRLTVQMLAGPVGAEALENPRQVPAWRYSRRFGPTPPTFARAAVLPTGSGLHPGALLIAGTASVVGEESRHPGDLDAQAAETCTNLATLLGAAAGDPLPEAAPAAEEDARLAGLRHLRVYVTRAEDLPAVGRLFARRCPTLETLTLMHAPLCRPELLLEAEGISVDGLGR